MTLFSALVNTGAGFYLRGGFRDRQEAQGRSGRGCGLTAEAGSCRGGPGRAARAAPPEAPAGSAAAPLGTCSPRTKQKGSASLAFWVSRLGTARIQVVRSFPPLVYGIIFPLSCLCPWLFYVVDFSDLQSLQLSLSLFGGYTKNEWFAANLTA